MANFEMNNSSPQRSHPQRFNTQTGWTFWSLLFVMTVVLFFAYVGMQLVPIYSTNENIKNAMEQSLDGQNLRQINRSTIVKGIKAQLFLDGSGKVLDYSSDLTVQRSPRKLLLSTNYEREIPLFFNLFVLVKFNNVIERELRDS